ncbi:DsbA family protein [Aquicella lusitana]|mgnify:CR=1 FL=1|uniref:Protein-disulfide isomerase n=1 Tax=Aquicella lusitana TaxID=254246 RepID=A0A370G8E9_9COXI|nr:DsbA family protein [Aquicella lusitana]RDI39209.1 protein-disulfide isomerase [Aquicella lusitana]VVC74068.1 Thiol:disulfide interchange protein DsbA [Aquicella lusitana]
MKRFAKSTLTAALFALAAQSYAATAATNNATAAPSNAAANVSPAERAKIEEVVHQYLIRKPEVVVEALQTLQRKQFEEAEQTVKKTQADATQYANALFHQANDPVAGNPNGKVTVVEFFDYQCPHCVDMAPAIEGIIKANKDVRIVFKEFPIRGPMSEFAARAALAANKQGKYYPFSHALLSAKQPLTEESVLKIAADNGLDVEKLKKDMNDSSVEAQLKANFKLAQDLKLFGTPAFFIAKSDVSDNKGNVTYIPGRMTQAQLQTEIDKAAK